MFEWQSPSGLLKLGRFPYDDDDKSLRAWNGADILLAEHMATLAPKRTILILNDNFGALACAAIAAGHTVWSQTDSWMSRHATNKNLLANKQSADAVHFVDSLATPQAPQPFDTVLMQLPKAKALLEYQLATLAATLPTETQIVAGGMTRDVHSSTTAAFETHIGPTKTSLAAHKARLVHSAVKADQTPPNPSVWPKTIPLQEIGLPQLDVLVHSGVFAAHSHDKGSLYLLNYLARWARTAPAPAQIIDCACGSGILGLVAAQIFASAQVLLTDESHMAVESAKASFAHSQMTHRAQFLHTDCLHGAPSATADLVVCNPPFHLGTTQTYAIGRRMFHDAHRCLRPTGTLIAVFNQHLGHKVFLQDTFARVKVVAENSSYSIVQCGK